MEKRNSDNQIELENSSVGHIHIGDIYQNVFQTAFTFNSKQFREIIEMLNETFIKEKIYDSLSRKDIIRDVNNENKNRRHNLLQEDYREKILNTVAPFKDAMDNFFANPRNSKLRIKYEELIKNLNMTYKAYEKKYDNIFLFFCQINDKMKEKYSTELEEYDVDIIQKFLCYAYFICDLDKDK